MNADNSRQNDIAMRALCECIDGYGNSGAYVSPELHRRIVAQWKKLDEACPDMQPIFLAESCAFGTTGFPLGGPRCQRGSYFGTCAPGWAGRDPVEFPVGSDVSDDVIAYWQARVEAAGFPRIKAHYSDLVWEYSEGRKIKGPHKYANRAANEYLNAYAEDPQMRYCCADRAIHLAITVNDQSVVKRAATLILDRLQQSPAG